MDLTLNPYTIGYLFGFFGLLFIYCLFLAVCLWRIFEKAGQKGINGLIPIHNLRILLTIIDKNELFNRTLIIFFLSTSTSISVELIADSHELSDVYLFGTIISFALNIYLFYLYYQIFHALALSFGKGKGFSIGLFFLTFIYLPILAFGKAQYIGPNGIKCHPLDSEIDQIGE
jgi:magnesium-transporting ATPase (P-type)